MLTRYVEHIVKVWSLIKPMDTHAQTWQNTLILPCKLRLQSIPQSLGVHLVKITPKKGWDIALNCVIKIRN